MDLDNLNKNIIPLSRQLFGMGISAILITKGSFLAQKARSEGQIKRSASFGKAKNI
jgi:hypothetical protein